MTSINLKKQARGFEMKPPKSKTVSSLNINICHKKVKNNLSNLSGTYILISNNTFILDNIEFKILKRKKVSRYKTPEYLALFENKKFESYISSLYLISDKNSKIQYNFDYKSIEYILTIDLDKRVVIIDKFHSLIT